MFPKKKLLLNVLLHPKAKNNFEIGLGYTIDTGLRTKIIWKKPWINAYGHSLESSYNVSSLEQFINFNYKIPLISTPIEQFYLLQVGSVYDNAIYVPSSIFTINIARCWNYFNSWQYAMNLHWYCSHCIQEQERTKRIKTLIYPGISMGRIRQRGGIVPYWGDSQRYLINVSNVIWRSNVNFIVLQAQNIWVRTFLKKHRFLLRANYSWIETNNISSIASSLRFFYNKDCGIRGYKYKFLSSNALSKDSKDIATKLIIGTVEYQYNLINKWWGAIFIDMGEVTNNIQWNNFKSGIGVGIRCQLPVGPVKLDIATPLINKHRMNNKLLYFYINLGPEL